MRDTALGRPKLRKADQFVSTGYPMLGHTSSSGNEGMKLIFKDEAAAAEERRQYSTTCMQQLSVTSCNEYQRMSYSSTRMHLLRREDRLQQLPAYSQD
jgi:hypothetical protein